MKVKVGFGCDTHRLIAIENEGIVKICGVGVPAHYRVDAHSDGDVGLHSIVDAMLGACGLGDIGDHFPPSDPSYKGSDSRFFIEQTLLLLQGMGAEISNVDVTIISQNILLGKLKLEMRESIAHMLSLDIADVSVKAKTAERMGALGRGEGIGAYVVILITLPE